MARRKAASAKKASRKTASRKAAKPGKKAVRKAARKTARPAKAAKRAAPARKKAPAKKAKTTRKTAPKAAVRAKAKAPARKAAAKAPARKVVAKAVERKAPNLNRARRVVLDDDVVASPPSTLDMDRTASAARSGRRALHDRIESHHETGPEMTAGDVDADWESAYAVGDEAPGGDNPTPDQDVVDEIGHAVGVEYQDNEELKGADKVIKRDEHRWELDPASADDWEDRD